MFESGSIIFRLQSIGKQVFQKDLEDVDAAAKKVTTSTTTAGKSTEELGKKQDETSKKTKGLGNELTNMSEKGKQAASTVGRSLLGVGASLIAVTALAVKAAIDWESAWAGVTKTVDANPVQLEKIEEGLRDLAKTLPATHGELAAVAEAAGQLGVASKDIVGFTETMVQLGETTNLTSDEAATAIAQLMNIMQTAPADVDRLGSALVALGNNGASTEKDIILMAQRIAGAGKIVGLTEAEVLSLANALASVGIEVEAGGSAISRIMIDMAKQVSTNGKDLEKWAAVAGMTSAQFSKAFKDDPAQAINSFIKGLGQMDKAGGDVFTTLESLGQSDIRVSNALLSMANAEDLLTDSLKTGATAWEENIALQAEADKRFDTTASKLKILGNNVNDAAINLGSTFLPVLSDAVEGLTAFTSFLADVPAPLLGIMGAATLGIGAVALFGGALLIAVPKIAEFRLAVRTLTTEMPIATARVKGFAAFMGGPWGIAIGIAVAALAAFGTSQAEQKAKVESFTATLDEQTGKITASTRELVKSNLAAKNSFWWMENDSAYDAAKKLGLGLDVVTEAATGNVDALKKVKAATEGKALTSREAIATMKELGLTEHEYLAAAKAVRDGVQGESASIEEAIRVAKQKQSVDGDSADATDKNSLSIEAQTAATEAAIAKSEEWRAEIQEQDAAFVDLTGAYDSVVAKNQAVAESTAEATVSTKDSWETFYDGVTIAIGDYILELQKQVDAQNNWESNMILLAGRVSEAMLDELGKLGPEGAPLVAALVTASDEELSKMEGLYAEKAGAATGAFATTLANSQTIIAAAGAQLGEATAQEIATKLANGTATVAQIMDQYDLEITSHNPAVTVDTTPASLALEKFMQRWNGAAINLTATGSGRLGSGILEADGGKVNFYGNGGRENHIAQFARAGTMRVWAEQETGGEWYIPASPAKRAQSTQILSQAANEFGYQLVPKGAQSFADGGRSSDAQIMSGRTAKPLRIEGTLDLGNGLTGVIRGVINDLGKEL